MCWITFGIFITEVKSVPVFSAYTIALLSGPHDPLIWYYIRVIIFNTLDIYTLQLVEGYLSGCMVVYTTIRIPKICDAVSKHWFLIMMLISNYINLILLWSYRRHIWRYVLMKYVRAKSWQNWKIPFSENEHLVICFLSPVKSILKNSNIITRLT